MKKITLLFAALFCVMAISARTIYYDASQVNYPADNAIVAMWTWGGSTADTWIVFSYSGTTNYYVAEIADDKTGGKIVRKAPGSGSDNWNDIYNQSGNLVIPADKNVLKLTEWNDANHWEDNGNSGDWGHEWYAGEATGVTLDESSLNLEAGTSAALVATVAPVYTFDKTITWKSDDKEVATVENGVVTAVAVGDAIITAETANGKTTTCNVTVTAPAKTYVTSITIDPAQLTLTAGETSSALTVTVLPDDAADKTYTWKSDNEDVATIANGVVTAVAKGTANITATAKDGSGIVGTCVVTVNPKLYTFAVKFHNNQNWEHVYIYAWGDGIESGVGMNAWPGKELTVNEGGWYVQEFTNAAPNFLFHNNLGGDANQTVDITDVTSDVCFELGAQEGGDNGKYTVKDDIACDQVFAERVTGITLSKSTLKIRPDHTYQLFATIAPEDATNKGIAWSSSDSEQVSVDENGRVKAISGSATITATAKDGSGVKAECVVTVSTDADALAGITLNFKKHEDWEKVYLWAWTKVNGANFNFFESWPGKEITNADAEGVYSYTFDANYSSISFILNNGPQAEGVIILQTTDITIEENTCVSVTKSVTPGENEGDPESVVYASTIVDCNTWEPAVIHVESLAWYEGSEPRAEIAVGDIEYVNIAINPNTATNQTLQFDSSVAGIVSGTIAKHPTGGYPVLTIKALAEGKTTITITSEDNKDAKLSYSLTVVKPIETALENAEVEAKAIKVIENGQLIIIRDGVRYNVLGGIIK